MSTEYYRLKHPLTSIRVVENDGHVRITLWEEGANIGTLVVSKRNAPKILLMVAEEEPALVVVNNKGKVTVAKNQHVSPDEWVVSEYGKPIQAEQLVEEHTMKQGQQNGPQ